MCMRTMDHLTGASKQKLLDGIVFLTLVSTWSLSVHRSMIDFWVFLYPVIVLNSFILEVSGKFLGIFYVDDHIIF